MGQWGEPPHYRSAELMRGLAVLPAVTVAAAATVVAVSAQAPLPEPTAFLAGVRARLASNDELRAEYAYRERRTEVRLNPFGRMGTGPARVYEVYPGPDGARPYRRLIEEDGEPVPPGE